MGMQNNLGEPVADDTTIDGAVNPYASILMQPIPLPVDLTIPAAPEPSPMILSMPPAPIQPLAQMSVEPAGQQANDDLFGEQTPPDHTLDLFAPALTRNAEPAAEVDIPVPAYEPAAPESAPTADQIFSDQIAAAIKPAETASVAFEYDNQLPAIERLLHGLVHNRGSDMHLVVGEVPYYRIKTDLTPLENEEVFTRGSLLELLEGAAKPKDWERFQTNNELDFAYAMSEETGSPITSRFRVNFFRSLEEPAAVFRVIPTKIKTLDDLGIPPIVKKLAELPRGLVWITGPTGSGKSTTGAALLDLINETRADRIFTIEDPVEFVHRSKRCLVSHREVNEDTESFSTALRAVRREDPDVIYIGEVRDLETMEAAIEAADSGHLVIATLHTSSAPETILRIINSFPEGKQDQIRTTLASNIRAVICQTLVKSKEKGLVAACEIMMVTDAIRHNIAQNDIKSIRNAMTDTSHGSKLLDMHLAELITSGLISKKDALKKASSHDGLESYLGSGRSGAVI